MPDAFTANFNLTKPEVGASRDVWGNKWNANADAIDTALQALTTSKLSLAGGKITGQVDFDGPIPRHRVSTGPDVYSELATRAWVATQLAALLPNGIIAKWKGTVASIPAGWALCNGANGTPNLVDRFIVGAGDTAAGATYAPAASGGATTHNHGGYTDYHSLTSDQNGPHSHGVSDPGHSHNVNDPQHRHYFGYGFNDGGDNNALSWNQGSGSFNYQRPSDTRGEYTEYSQTNISIYGATTNISVASSGGGQGHRHGVAAADNRPPYYALCFIMKL